MIKRIFISFLITLCFINGSRGQVLQNHISTTPGTYSCEEVIKILESQGVLLSYSSASLMQSDLNLKEINYTVEQILPRLFDLKNFRFIEKEGKVLIVPINKGEITISGFVEDAKSQERLIGVNVYLPQLKAGTVTNKYGFYSLSIPPPADSLELMASFMGYSNKRVPLSPHSDHKVDISLQLQNEELEEVLVTDKDQRVSATQMSQVILSIKEIKAIPAFFGETDILKSIQLLPGVQSSSEGSVNYIVRGGGPDQNLILLDGVPVYNAAHLFGYFSVFNVDAIKNVSFTKGGFPARFGGRLSSILEIDMKEGNMEKYHGAGSIGLLASKLTLEGPLIKNKASFMISGRRTYFDVFYRPFLEKGNDAGYFFDDLNAKINYKFSRNDRIYLSFYTGRDKLFAKETRNDNKFESYFTYGNRTAALRWNHLINDKVFSNLTATYSLYNLSLGVNYKTGSLLDALEYYSRMEDYGLKYETDYSFSATHHFKIGGAYTYHIFKPGAIQYNQEDTQSKIDSLLALSPFNYSNDMYVFAEDDWKINERWQLNAGLHYSAYLVGNHFYNALQPRITGRFLLNKDWSLKASYSYMEQYIHLLTNSGAGLPTDLWVSSTGRIPPQQSHQWALGTTKDLWDNRWAISSEIYYKYMTNLISFKEGTLFTSSANWEDQVVTHGKGHSYGWELLIQKKSGKTTGWISYTLARATRQFEDINDGNVFPYKYDRRHDLKLVVNHNFTEHFNMSFAFVINSGLKATVPIGMFNDIYGNSQILYSSRNAYEYPTYHRMDLAFNWTKKKKWGERTWTVALYNAYNHQNPYFIYFTTSQYQHSAHQVSMFPIMPAFRYSFNF